ncbi:hypothetical protein Tco_0567660 [Tanacetum coccineum]
MGVLIVSRRTFRVCEPDESDPLDRIGVFEYQGCHVRDAGYAVGSSISKSELPGNSYAVDSTVSSIEPNVELASNIVTNSSLGDRILNVGMTDTADNSVDADPSISSKSSTRESGSTVRIRASWKPLVGMLARGGLEFESHPGLLPLQAE